MKKALVSSGVVVLGLRINMYDDPATHVRDPSVTRENDAGKVENCMDLHSVTCLGYVRIAGADYFVLKETMGAEYLGFKDTGLCLLATAGFELAEIVVVTDPERGAARAAGAEAKAKAEVEVEVEVEAEAGLAAAPAAAAAASKSRVMDLTGDDSDDTDDLLPLAERLARRSRRP